VLPSEYDAITRISLPVAFVLAAAQLLFFWNVFQTVRGRSGVATFDERGIPEPAEPSRDWTAPTAEAALVLVALALALAFAVAGYLVGRESGDGGGTTVTVTEASGGATTGGGSTAGDPANGAKLFASLGCGGCHTLAAAGAAGELGPSLDGNAGLTKALVVARVANGKGTMPAFRDKLDEEKIQDLAAYLLQSTKK
jgi:cytochrome c6